MKTIDIIVRDKVAHSPHVKMVCGNSDYFIHFDFDDEWDEYPTKTARFIYGGKFEDVPFEGDTVNAPIIVNASIVAVGVFAGELRTTTPALIATDKSILCKGGLPADPPPDVYNKIIAMLNAIDAPSWNDLTDKPFYAESAVILPETSPVYDENEQAFLLTEVVNVTADSEYVVTWNGVEYTCVAQDLMALMDAPAVGLGNLGALGVPGYEDTGEPFFMMILYPEFAAEMGGVTGMMVSLEGLTEVTLSISGETVHKLDSKYIDWDESPNKALAEAAQATADTAVANAQTAQTAANTAQTTANEAKTAAQTASTNATTAQTRADEAYEYAHAVGTTAVNANSSATRAATTANSAKTLANTANTTANTAKTAAQTAQSTADEAKTAAQTAQSTADGKMSATNPVGTGSFSMNRKADTTIGSYSHAEGYNTTASAQRSHAEGYNSTASGTTSHAEGVGTTASANASHAEGVGTTASANASHAEGSTTTASGANSHAEGNATNAKGANSHAEGNASTATGENSHAEGWGTIATPANQHVQGKYNKDDGAGKYAHIVGNGTAAARSNAHTLDWEGNAWYAGSVEGTAMILSSPNGTRFTVTVDDSGALTVAEVTE